MLQVVEDKESVKVLKECVSLQLQKSADYQNPNSRVKQADYYRRGIDSIYDMLHTKMLRIESLLESARGGKEPNFEGIEDTLKDLINYASFGVSWMRKKMDGQDTEKNIFNETVPKKVTYTAENGMPLTFPLTLDGMYSNTVLNEIYGRGEKVDSD